MYVYTVLFQRCVFPCTDNSVCKSGDVRLTGGHSSDEGQVEVCVGNQWSTVCEDHWTDRGAAVVCNQLGYTRQGTVLDTLHICIYIYMYLQCVGVKIFTSAYTMKQWFHYNPSLN